MNLGSVIGVKARVEVPTRFAGACVIRVDVLGSLSVVSECLTQNDPCR